MGYRKLPARLHNELGRIETSANRPTPPLHSAGVASHGTIKTPYRKAEWMMRHRIFTVDHPASRFRCQAFFADSRAVFKRQSCFTDRFCAIRAKRPTRCFRAVVRSEGLRHVPAERADDGRRRLVTGAFGAWFYLLPDQGPCHPKALRF